MESRSWRDRNLKFGPNCDLEVGNLEKNKKFDSASPRQIFNLFPNYPPPDHNLGQILNSDLASSYFPLKLGPHLVPILTNLGPHSMWEQCSGKSVSF